MRKLLLVAVLSSLVVSSYLLNISCIPEVDTGPGQEAEMTVFFFGNGAGLCLLEPSTDWGMDIFVDQTNGNFWNTTTNFNSKDNNSKGFDIRVPTTGMYTITVEIYPKSSTSCMTCCSSICFPVQTGKPELRGLQTFTAPTFYHTINVDLEDCDCC